MTLPWIFCAAPRAKNFCLYLSHKAVHAPFQPPKSYQGIYNREDLHLPPEYKERGLNYKFCYPHSSSGLLRPGTMEEQYRSYCETLKALDDSIVRVFEELDKLKLPDNTVIIWAGDNGYMWGEHCLVDKRFAYEESMRIPWLVRAPGIIPAAGAIIDEMVLNIDLAPTFLDLAGLPIPHDMQGASFKPLLQGKNSPWRKSFLYEYFNDPSMPAPPIIAARTDDMKYVKYEKNRLPEELFDLKNDPRETTNLAADAASHARKQQMEEELRRLVKETGYQPGPGFGKI